MALSLPGERSTLAAAPIALLRALRAALARGRAARNRRVGLKNLLAFEPERLRDLGIDPSDIYEALRQKTEHGPMVLNAARCRNAKNARP